MGPSVALVKGQEKGTRGGCSYREIRPDGKEKASCTQGGRGRGRETEARRRRWRHQGRVTITQVENQTRQTGGQNETGNTAKS